MKRHYLRTLSIALLSWLFASWIDYSTDLEATLGLNGLFKIRGALAPPAEVVIVAMDERSETELQVGNDLTRWRGFHAKLIQEAQKQGAKLVVFDLQFIQPHPNQDAALAAAMRAAGNVLIVECVQKFRQGVADFYGREECSERNKQPPVTRENQPELTLPEQMVAMRKLAPVGIIGEAVLDSAPFILLNDAENTTIREAWTFYDELAESPSLPVLVWFYIQKQAGALTDMQMLLSVWLTEQRRACSTPPALSLPSPATEHRIADLICQGDSRYLNYYGPPKTLRMESYSDVYHGKVTDLHDKVLFVGRANRQFSPGKADFFSTPYTDSHTGKMAGVEIMATQFANLSQDNSIAVPVPFWLASCLFGLTIACLAVRVVGWLGIVASLSVSALYTALVFSLFAHHHGWLPIAAPLLIQLPLSLLMALVWSRYDLLLERRRLLAFVGRVFPQWLSFLPASPGNWSEDKNLPAKAEKDVHGLCLATDIEGYTAIASQHTPREMWHLLNAYYQVLGLPVVSRDGEIADVTGDSMMAVWFDMPAASQRRAACLAALDMELAIASFNESAAHASLTTRIGLHEGELTLGVLDAGKGSHYRAIGDTVNTASRIQGVNKYLGTRILASKAIVADLDDIEFRPVGLFCLAGRAEPVELVEIVGTVENINAKQTDLYRQFAEGLELFRLANWMEAARLFQNLLTVAPSDGPTRFYLNLALEFSQNPELVWKGFVSLESK